MRFLSVVVKKILNKIFKLSSVEREAKVNKVLNYVMYEVEGVFFFFIFIIVFKDCSRCSIRDSFCVIFFFIVLSVFLNFFIICRKRENII